MGAVETAALERQHRHVGLRQEHRAALLIDKAAGLAQRHDQHDQIVDADHVPYALADALGVQIAQLFVSGVRG